MGAVHWRSLPRTAHPSTPTQYSPAHLRFCWRGLPVAMDPLSALSLAANVFQVVGFAIQIAQLGKQIHNRGTTVGYDELETICKDFDSAKLTLDTRLNTVGTSTDEEKQVKAIAEEASALVAQLEMKLAKIKTNASKSKSESVIKAFKAVWSRNDILETEKHFLGFRDELTFRLVVLLNGKADEEAIKHSVKFESLDDTTKQIISALLAFQDASKTQASQILGNQSQHEQSAEKRHQELLQLVRAAIPKQSLNPEHFLNQSSDPNKANAAVDPLDEGRKETIEAAVLSSLWFPSIQDREDAITERYSDTFSWIWEDPQLTQKPWSDFRAFLRSDMGAYWITGKAGSGKSTLMKYINECKELGEELDLWRQDKPLIRLSFYFWYSGTQEQKSERGVLLSLLHQILNPRKELIRIAFKERVRAMVVSPDPPTSFLPKTPELRRAIFAVLEHLKDARFFISVDGLDEYSRDEDGFTDVAQFFLSFLRLQNVKLLLSSRPEREFETEFINLPFLRLQDLTLPDIQKYVNEKLRHSRLQDLQLIDPLRCEKLVAELVLGSAGVFLWVCVVVKILLTGLNNGESLDDLEAELVRLPTELDDLYDKVLARIPARYRAKMVLMMEIVRLGTENGSVLSALGLSWALETEDQVLQNVQPFTTDEIVRRYETLIAQVQSHALGLLEICNNNGIGQSKDEYDWYIRVTDVMPDVILPVEYRERATSLVTFLHRSVSEFMMKSPSYLGLVEDFHPNGIVPALSLLQSAIANVKAQLSLIGEKDMELAECTGIPSAVHHMVFNTLHWARVVGDRGNALVEELDTAMSKGARHMKPQEIDTHSIRTEKWHWTHLMQEYCYRDVITRSGYGAQQFMAFAVRHGLESFLRMKLEGINGPKPNEKEKNYLLLNALRPGGVYVNKFRTSEFSLPLYPNIVECLLKAGANPNTTIGRLHTWEGGTEKAPLAAFVLGIQKEGRLTLAQITTMKILIANGADPNLRIDFWAGKLDNEKHYQMSVLSVFKILSGGKVAKEARTGLEQIITDLEARFAVEQMSMKHKTVKDISIPLATTGARSFLRRLRQVVL